MRETIMRLAANAAIKSAERAGNCASIMGLHQPREPKDMQRRLAAMQDKLKGGK